MSASGAVTCHKEIAESFVRPVLGKFGKRSVSIAPARTYVSGEGLRFLNADVRIGAEGDQFVCSIADNEAAISPVIPQANLMNNAATHLERFDALCNENPHLNFRAGAGDNGPIAIVCRPVCCASAGEI